MKQEPNKKIQELIKEAFRNIIGYMPVPNELWFKHIELSKFEN